MINALDFLFLVLTFGFIPVFVLVSMILWRIYKNMDRIDNILTFFESIMSFTRNLDQIPGLIVSKITQYFK